MIRPTTLSASFAMVSPMYALPRLSGTCTLNQLLAFQPSTLLPTCFFFAILSPCYFIFPVPADGTCVLRNCQVHQIIVYGCDDRPELCPGDRCYDPVSTCLRFHAAEVVRGKCRGNTPGIVVHSRDGAFDLHHEATASCQPFANRGILSQGIVAPARSRCPPPFPPQDPARVRTSGPRSAVVPAGQRAEILQVSPLFA